MYQMINYFMKYKRHVSHQGLQNLYKPQNFEEKSMRVHVVIQTQSLIWYKYVDTVYISSTNVNLSFKCPCF